jgi:hypothetical protein
MKPVSDGFIHTTEKTKKSSFCLSIFSKFSQADEKSLFFGRTLRTLTVAPFVGLFSKLATKPTKPIIC